MPSGKLLVLSTSLERVIHYQCLKRKDKLNSFQVIFYFRLSTMSWVEFITAFKIESFELRVLGYELFLSPTQLELLDERLSIAFETHYDRLVRVLDGFHVIHLDKVGTKLRLIISSLNLSLFSFLSIYFRVPWESCVFTMSCWNLKCVPYWLNEVSIL